MLETGAFPVEPLDEANQTLLDNVHPADWSNPTPQARYHLVVFGAGTAGLVAAAGAAGLGARVALIENHLMGGDCLNVGCVPSKAVLEAARSWQRARTAAATFGGPQAAGGARFGEAMARMRRLRAALSPTDSAARFRSLGVDVFFGAGRFVAADTAEVGGARLRFRRALIATGARPLVPDFPGLAAAGYRTNETIFNLTALPPRLGVIGGGPIGCELAQAFARFGSEVVLVHCGAQLLGREDADAARLVEQALNSDGVATLLSSTVQAASVAGKSKRLTVATPSGQRSLDVDEILVATGRLPTVENLGLETAGVRSGPQGVAVDDRLRTSNPRIYAAGDVASPHRFTHLADAQARLVIENALFFLRRKASALTVPWCTYTDPEVAHVGLTAAQARELGAAVDTLTLALADNTRALLDGAAEGFLRLHLRSGSDTILGATLVAAHAGELISELTLAISQGIGLAKLGSVIHPYPTQSEVIKQAADQWRRGKLTPRAQRFFARWFRVFS